MRRTELWLGEVGFHRWLGVSALLLLAFLPHAAESVRVVNGLPVGLSRAGGDSCSPVLAAGGRHVFFLSSAPNLTTNLAGGFPNVFRKDRESGEVVLVSVAVDGGAANGPCSSPVASTNGEVVLFLSRATNLLPEATNGWENLFVRDLAADRTELISAGTNGQAVAGGVRRARMTPDGRHVVYMSAASDLAPGDANGVFDVFVHDRLTGTTRLVSVNRDGTGSGAGSSVDPSISDDGRWVAFVSGADDLAPNDMNARMDVLVRDLEHGVTTAVSVGKDGNTTGYHSSEAEISGDGRWVYFETFAYQIASNDSSFSDVVEIYGRDLVNGTTFTALAHRKLPFGGARSQPKFAVSADGRWVLLEHVADYLPGNWLRGGLYAWDTAAGTVKVLSAQPNGITPASGMAHSPVLSADSRYVVFASNATNMVGGVTNGTFQVYRADLASGAIELVSVGLAGDGNNLDCSGATTIDGQVIAFTSRDDSLVAGDDNGEPDVFVRDMSQPACERISKPAAGLISSTPFGASRLTSSALSTDGRFIAFAAVTDRLVSNDTNRLGDVFVRDMETGALDLVSVNTNGVSGNGDSRGATISGDGRWVAFLSKATDLVPGVTTPVDNVYLRDRESNITVLVSKTVTAASGSRSSADPVLSRDGRVLAYSSRAPNLSPIDTGTQFDVFTYEMDVDTNRLISVSTAGTTRPEDSRSPALSPQGSFVVWVSDARGYVTNYVPRGTHIYLRDLRSGEAAVLTEFVPPGDFTTRLGPQTVSDDERYVVFAVRTLLAVYDRNARTWIGGSRPGRNPALSGDGRWVAFERSRSDGSGLNDVWVWDTHGSAEVLISANPEGQPAHGGSRAPGITPDGRYVVFVSDADDLVDGDTNGASDVFARDVLLGRTTLLSAGPAGPASGGPSRNPLLSADGRTVVFESRAHDLVPDDRNGTADLFLVRLSWPDTDDDGMDDDWEVGYFDDLSRDGTGDYDGDGVNDLAEFKGGTDPRDDASILRVMIVTGVEDGRTTLLWAAAAGRSYQVQFKDALEASWQGLPETVTATDTQGRKIDDTAPLTAHRFYRVVVVAP